MTQPIFISYSKKDSRFSHGLADQLRSAGFKVWIDDHSIGGGEEWRKSIEMNLENAGEVIVVVSPNSMASQWVNHEVRNFKQNGVLIDEDTLRVIQNARERLTIDQEAEELIAKSAQVIEARLQQERQVQAELEQARRQRERLLYRVGFASLALTLVLDAVLRVFAPVRSVTAPFGMVSLELAGSRDAFEAMVAPWDKMNYFLAGFNLGIDFLYMFVYSTAAALGCFWASRKLRQRNHHWMAKLGVWAGYGMWAAAAFDAIENIALVLTFKQSSFAPGPVVTAAALMKFLLIFLGILFVMVSLAILRVWPQGQPEQPDPTQ